MIKGVLFDFDGVIVQSEKLHMKTFLEVLRPFSISVSEERWYREFAGTGSRNIMTVLLKENRIDADIQALVEKRKKIYEACVMRGELKETRGIRAFLKLLKEKSIRTAIVSGSHRTNVAAALSYFGMQGLFDVIVSGDDLELRKPDPGPFLHAAEKLGVTPGECLVIEDSAAGCEAARRAGMRLVVMESPAAPFVGKSELVIGDFSGYELERLLA